MLWTASYFALQALHSWGPAADAWILTGSILATYGMARGWVEFWLIWIAVDIVGVPLLLTAGYYPSAIMYIVYGVFCVVGFISWWRIERRQRGRGPARPGVDDPVIETVALIAAYAGGRDGSEDLRVPLRRAGRQGGAARGRLLDGGPAGCRRARDRQEDHRGGRRGLDGGRAPVEGPRRPLEISQLLYHLQVLMLALDLDLDDVYAHL